MKRILIVLISIMILFSGCTFSQSWEQTPWNQPGTKWVSEDGNAILQIKDEPGVSSYRGEITIKNQNESKTLSCHVLYSNHSYNSIYIEEYGSTDISQFENIYEQWKGVSVNENTYEVKVQKSTYFKIGEKIVFNRVDE